jgi:predicted nucleic acid-binding protein
VPALDRAFQEPVPDQLYVDTDIFINYLFSSQPHHERCRPFLDRLRASVRTTLFVSPLSWLELAHVITRPSFRDDLADDLQRQYRVGRWHQPQIRQAYLDGLLADFDALLDQFTWVEVPLSPVVRRLAIRFMAEYGLGSQDAIHLASAAQAGVTDIASFDAVYRRVDALNLWNDRIHGDARQ